MNMMNMQHMNNSFHHNSSQISETTYSMKAENQLIGGKKKNSSTFNTSKYMAHSPSPSQTFFKGKIFVRFLQCLMSMLPKFYEFLEMIESKALSKLPRFLSLS